MSPAATIEAAIAIISNGRNWIQGELAHNAGETPVKPEADNAKRFCMVGAVRHVADDNKAFELAIRALRNACGMSPFTFNDTHGHKKVLKAMGHAIEIARAA